MDPDLDFICIFTEETITTLLLQMKLTPLKASPLVMGEVMPNTKATRLPDYRRQPDNLSESRSYTPGPDYLQMQLLVCRDVQFFSLGDPVLI